MTSQDVAKPALVAVAQGASRKYLNLPGLVVLLVLAGAWQIASRHLPHFLFPPLEDVVKAAYRLVQEPAFLSIVLHTYARILVATAVAFVLAVSFGILAGLSSVVDRAAAPVLALMQGVPAICWIIFAILWFKNVEARIAFIVVISTAPSFFFQSRDAVLSISTDLREMVRSWRPTHYQVITKLVVPALTPVLLTTLLVNLGIATKVGVTAELLAGTSGIGGELRTAQEQFRMEMAIAWTIPLVFFIFLTNVLTKLAQKSLLRWRPVVSHAE